MTTFALVQNGTKFVRNDDVTTFVRNDDGTVRTWAKKNSAQKFNSKHNLGCKAVAYVEAPALPKPSCAPRGVMAVVAQVLRTAETQEEAIARIKRQLTALHITSSQWFNNPDQYVKGYIAGAKRQGIVA